MIKKTARTSMKEFVSHLLVGNIHGSSWTQ